MDEGVGTGDNINGEADSLPRKYSLADHPSPTRSNRSHRRGKVLLFNLHLVLKSKTIDIKIIMY